MKNVKQFALLPLLVLALSSCDEEGGDLWACDTVADNSACIEYTGSEWNGPRKSNYTAVCTSHPGTVVAACPTSWTGKCKFFTGTGAAVVNYYYDADTSSEATSCSVGGGTWVTP